ncbi:phage tail spike protein [Paenibacillus filicis]|uniref:Phage tail spike protein n=1 Tax=Paenibacillus filicis TaxID=669464 RepID=A0ABU9DVS2_9BACL
MRKSYVTIYDLQMRKVAYLENAANISYEMPLNIVWSASFELPLDDPKNEHCRSFHYVEIFDGQERVELFRILPSSAQRTEQTRYVKYQCEHVLATLLDDVLFRYHTVGNLGYPTANVLQYILDRQTKKHWKLGTVEFTRQFEYNFENAGLLASLFSVPKAFAEEYQWTFDTRSYPWTLNLVRPSDQVKAIIRYGRNMRGITKTEDPTNLVNRLYALGYGEGVNQLTVAEANNGLPYVEDAASIAQYGLKASVWADRRFTSAETLKGRADAILAESKAPRVSYSVQAAEIYALTRDPMDRFRSGDMVRVQDPDIGDLTIRVVNVQKANVLGAPGDVVLEIANRPQDIAGTISDLQNRMKIEEIYAQGATNLDSHDLAENCDPAHPAVLSFRIDENAIRINKVLLSYKSEAFRAYSKAIEGGGAVATTTGAGGAVITSTAGGGGVVTSTASGGSVSKSTESGGGTVTSAADGEWFFTGQRTITILTTDGDHSHQVMTSGGSGVAVQNGSHSHKLNHEHNHKVTIPDHSHGFTVPNHIHELRLDDHTHNLTLKDHTHKIDLPNHVHGIEYGIYEGPRPAAVTVKVDGVSIPGLGTNVEDLDIIPYLSKDGGGKINRGWHSIEIAPDKLGRIVASINTQIFVQSRGGGDY